jgi:hypothetical protein
MRGIKEDNVCFFDDGVGAFGAYVHDRAEHSNKYFCDSIPVTEYKSILVPLNKH